MTILSKITQNNENNCSRFNSVMEIIEQKVNLPAEKDKIPVTLLTRHLTKLCIAVSILQVLHHDKAKIL